MQTNERHRGCQQGHARGDVDRVQPRHAEIERPEDGEPLARVLGEKNFPAPPG